jgi:hypothetical protein
MQEGVVFNYIVAVGSGLFETAVAVHPGWMFGGSDDLFRVGPNARIFPSFSSPFTGKLLFLMV